MNDDNAVPSEEEENIVEDLKVNGPCYMTFLLFAPPGLSVSLDGISAK